MHDHVGLRQRARQRGIVAHVADAEREQFLRVPVDHFVGRALAVQIRQPHVVLLRLVAREHRDAGRPAGTAGQQSAYNRLAERAGASRHEHS